MAPLQFKRKITDAETFYVTRHNAETAPEMIVKQNWRLFKVAPPVPELDTSAVAMARVDGSRWLVACPWCVGDPQYASRVDHRFFCVQCGNVEVGGRWIPVAWPDDWAAIEEALLRRPNPDRRHWLPTETILDLLRENREHAAEILAGA